MNLAQKYSTLFGSPYLLGVFMGVNAIKDAAVYVDGPDCNFFRVDMLYKTHDLFSTLKTPDVNTRLYFSGVMPNKMIRGYDEKIQKKLGFINKNSSFSVGIVTCMPVTGLLSTQYDALYRDFSKKFIFVPSFTDKFWSDGYSVLLKEIAKTISFSGKKLEKGKSISLIGFLYDRNEGDVTGNIEEIKRLLNIIGVSVDTIWLNGGDYESLKLVDQSDLLVTLPYGRMAGKELGKRLGKDVLDIDIPFGIKGTIDFLKEIGGKLGINEESITSLIESELLEIKQKINALDRSKFFGKRFIYAGDIFLERGIKDIGEFLGMTHVITYGYNGSQLDLHNGEIDVLIANSDYIPSANPEAIFFEFGFPSYNTHFLSSRPYMGFKGVINLIERLYYDIIKNKKGKK